MLSLVKMVKAVQRFTAARCKRWCAAHRNGLKTYRAGVTALATFIHNVALCDIDLFQLAFYISIIKRFSCVLTFTRSAAAAVFADTIAQLVFVQPFSDRCKVS